MKKQNHFWILWAVLGAMVAAAIVLFLFSQPKTGPQIPEGTSPSVSLSAEAKPEQETGPFPTPEQETAVPSPPATGALPSETVSPTPSHQPEKTVSPSSAPQKETPSSTPSRETPRVSPTAAASPTTPRPSAGNDAATASQKPAAASICTLTVRCDTLTAKRESLAPEIQEIVPANGVVLQTISLEPQEGETAFSLLQRAAREQRLHLEFQMTPGTGGVYVEGIGNLYEFDGGPLSGWLYRVNGVFYPESASDHGLSPGDQVEWIYTCDLGRDVGAPSLD